ncbi:MAG: hypothetical protein NTY48_05925, partial [Candidatus Diapherotrites archaeon]|nr:hypothetical protein [Candidatus Diapherotrites archaeon]
MLQGGGQNPHYCNGHVVVGSILYNRWIYNGGTGSNWSGDYDLNHLMLISSTDQNVWIDYDNDCNFLNDTNNNRHVGDSNIGTLLHSNGQMDGNGMLIFDVSSTNIKYLKNPYDFNLLSLSRDNFVGQFPVDENIGLPVMIKSSSGTPLPDVTVIVNRVLKLPSFGIGNPTEISTGWTAGSGTTNSSGYARMALNLSTPGTYMLEIRAT